MPGLFNQLNHETTELSTRASAELQSGLSRFFLMLRGLELGDDNQFGAEKKATLDQLQISKDLFELTHYLLHNRMLPEPPAGSEAQNLYNRLRDFGYHPPFNNNFFGSIATAEITRFRQHILAMTIPSVNLWETFNSAFEAQIRLVMVGLVVARLASLPHAQGIPTH